MSVLACGGEKGGVGKTTLAGHLAAVLAAYRRRVLLIETEPRPGALAWLGDRPGHLPRIEGMHERTVLPERGALESYGFDDVVIDVLGGDSDVLRSAMQVADVFVSPFRPSQLDLWKARWVAEALREERAAGNPSLAAWAVVNAASPYVHRKNEGPDARALLRAIEVETGAWRATETILYDRKAFVTAMGSGHAVHELGPTGTQAADEIGTLFDEMGVLRGLS